MEACKRLGMRQISAIMREFTEEEAFLARASENLVRNCYIDPIEEARGYKMLLDKGWTINAIGHRVGKSDSYVCERLALLGRLDQRILSRIANGKLSASHAELISRIPDTLTQTDVADLVAKKRLSVRSLENMLNHAPAPTKVSVENICDKLYVQIPREHLIAIGLDGNASGLFLYVRGRKLILETIERPTTRDETLTPSRGKQKFARANLGPNAQSQVAKPAIIGLETIAASSVDC